VAAGKYRSLDEAGRRNGNHLAWSRGGVPLPGGENPTGFHRAPAGGENAARFHPFMDLSRFWPGISGWQAEYRHAAALCAQPPHDGILPAGDDSG
jgi:hypothetical protein